MAGLVTKSYSNTNYDIKNKRLQLFVMLRTEIEIQGIGSYTHVYIVIATNLVYLSISDYHKHNNYHCTDIHCNYIHHENNIVMGRDVFCCP